MPEVGREVQGPPTVGLFRDFRVRPQLQHARHDLGQATEGGPRQRGHHAVASAIVEACPRQRGVGQQDLEGRRHVPVLKGLEESALGEQHRQVLPLAGPGASRIHAPRGVVGAIREPRRGKAGDSSPTRRGRVVTCQRFR